MCFNHCIFDSLQYWSTVLNNTFSSDSARNETLTYICANENNNSDKDTLELVGRLKHQDALKKETGRHVITSNFRLEFSVFSIPGGGNDD